MSFGLKNGLANRSKLKYKNVLFTFSNFFYVTSRTHRNVGRRFPTFPSGNLNWINSNFYETLSLPKVRNQAITKQIKGLLGLLGYYRKFIKHLSKITKAYTNCLKEGAQIEINDEYLSCLETRKNVLTDDLI